MRIHDLLVRSAAQAVQGRSAVQATWKNAAVATLTSLSLLTFNPAVTLPAHAAVAAPPVQESTKTWSAGNELRLADPRANGGRIADAAKILDATDRRQISQEIGRIESTVPGSQVLVVTVPDVPAGKSPKQTANELFNYWGIGSMERENGVLILLVNDARRVEIEVGLALERRFDNSWCTSMLQADVVPLFKEGRYGDGLLRGVQKIGERLREDGGGGYDVEPSGGEVSPTAAFALLGASIGGTQLLNIQYERGSRKCKQCGEVVDTAYIGAWNTTVQATNLVTGEKRRSYSCQACGNEGEFISTIPRYDSVRYVTRNGQREPVYYNKPSSSSSSRSGGSSSGRGGGGASW